LSIGLPSSLRYFPDMRRAQYVNGQYLDATALNLLATDAASGIQAAAMVWTQPGLVRPDVVSWGTAGLVVSGTFPSPFAVQFGSGVVAAAHGTTDGTDSTAYSVNMASLVPSSGPSVTAYIIATVATVQESATVIGGPPPGNPAYNPDFVPFNSYLESVNTFALSATTGVPDGVTQIELLRTTLTSGQVAISPASLIYAYQQPAGRVLAEQNHVVTGSVSLTAPDAGRVQIISASGITLTLPSVGSVNGLVFPITTSNFSGSSVIQANGVDPIAGIVGQPGTTTSVTVSGSSSFIFRANQGTWNCEAAGPNFLLSQPNTWTAPNTYLDATGLGGIIVSGTSSAGASIKMVGTGATPTKWLQVYDSHFQILNNAFSSQSLFTIDDSGNAGISGTLNASGGTTSGQVPILLQTLAARNSGISSNTTVTTGQAGTCFTISSSAQVTLPPVSTATNLSYSFIGTSGIATIVTSSGDGSKFVGGVLSTYNLGISLRIGDFVTVQSDGTNWHLLASSANVCTTAAFSSSNPPSSDLVLQWGQRIIIVPVGATTMPLKIAVEQGVYRMIVVTNSTNTTNNDWDLLPNNTSYSGAFWTSEICAGNFPLSALGNATTQPGLTTFTIPNTTSTIPIFQEASGQTPFTFDLYAGPVASDTIHDRGPIIMDMLISTFTSAKMIQWQSIVFGGPAIGATIWQDTVTPWTSLGTLQNLYSATFSGNIIVERLA
jgi:hypothetical protein